MADRMDAALGREQGNHRRADPLASVGQDRAGGQGRASRQNSLTTGHAAKHLDDPVGAGFEVSAGVVEGEDGGRSDGQRVAGLDADGLARLDRDLPRPSRPAHAGDPQERAGLGLGRADGVAFGARAVEGGKVDVRGRRFGQDQAEGVDQGDLDRFQGLGPVEDPGAGLVQRRLDFSHSRQGTILRTRARSGTDHIPIGRIPQSPFPRGIVGADSTLFRGIVGLDRCFRPIP
jgi:hypothetical protein